MTLHNFAYFHGIFILRIDILFAYVENDNHMALKIFYCFSSWFSSSRFSRLILIACRRCAAHIIDTFHWSITEWSALQVYDLY